MITHKKIQKTVLISLMLTIGACAAPNNYSAEATNTPAAKAEQSVDTAAHVDIAKIDAEKAFIKTSDVMRDVNANMDRARTANKMSILVVGANWCHDSVGLAQKFQDEEMVKILNANYEVSFVDAGFLTSGFDVAQRFGLPIYFATPTVFIIDPKTEKLVNQSDMDQFKNADAIPVEEYRAYFTKYASPKMGSAKHKASLTDMQKSTLKPLMAEIAAFEAKHVARIKAGYVIIGPMMASDPRPDNMMDIWMEVRKVRFNLPNDMAALRESTTNQVLAGNENIKLAFPDYGKYSWE
jgi:hypothetical protein